MRRLTGGVNDSTRLLQDPDTGYALVAKATTPDVAMVWSNAAAAARRTLGSAASAVIAMPLAIVHHREPSPERPPEWTRTLLCAEYTGSLDKSGIDTGPDMYKLSVLAGLTVTIEAFANCGLVHGDIKPANIFLQKIGGSLAVLLGDLDGVSQPGQPLRIGPSSLYGAPGAFITGLNQPSYDVYSFGMTIMWLFGGFDVANPSGEIISGPRAEPAALIFAKGSGLARPRWRNRPIGELEWVGVLADLCTNPESSVTIHQALEVVESHAGDLVMHFKAQMAQAAVEPDVYEQHFHDHIKSTIDYAAQFAGQCAVEGREKRRRTEIPRLDKNDAAEVGMAP